MQKYFSMLSDDKAMDMIGKIEKPFKDLPHLPKGLREFFVMIAPWLAIIGAVLSALGVVTSLGAVFGMANTMPYAQMLFPKNYFMVMAVSQALTAVLLYMAYKPLKAKMTLGWVYMYWNMILSVLTMVVGLVMGWQSSIVGLVLGTLIGLYLLFELKPHYTKKGMMMSEGSAVDSPDSK
jgi:amino acid transporter